MGRGSGRSSVVSGPAILAAVLDAAVDARARPVGAAVPAYGVYPLIILIVYVIVTGGILCSGTRPISPTTNVADGATYIPLGGHHIGHRPVFGPHSSLRYSMCWRQTNCCSAFSVSLTEISTSFFVRASLICTRNAQINALSSRINRQHWFVAFTFCGSNGVVKIDKC